MIAVNNINDFGPFQADVWGTVSDWVMIIVTVFTARYLYKTLTMSESESLRTIMPRFTLNPRSIQNNLSGAKFKLYQNPAIATEVYINGSQTGSGIDPIIPSMPVDYEFEISLNSKHYEEIELIEGRVFSLRFKDVEGNLYEQVIVQDDYGQRSLSSPELLSCAKKDLLVRSYYRLFKT